MRETAVFDPSWADARPVCAVCDREIPPNEAIILPGGRHVEDDEEVVGLLVHRSCPTHQEQDG